MVQTDKNVLTSFNFKDRNIWTNLFVVFEHSDHILEILVQFWVFGFIMSCCYEELS